MFGIVPRKLCGPSSEKCVSSDNAAISLGILPSRLLSSFKWREWEGMETNTYVEIHSTLHCGPKKCNDNLT